MPLTLGGRRAVQPSKLQCILSIKDLPHQLPTTTVELLLNMSIHTLITEKGLSGKQSCRQCFPNTTTSPGADRGWCLCRPCELVTNTCSQDNFSTSRYSQTGIWEKKEFSKSHDTIAPPMVIGDLTSKSSQLSPELLGLAKLNNLEIKNLIL